MCPSYLSIRFYYTFGPTRLILAPIVVGSWVLERDRTQAQNAVLMGLNPAVDEW